MRDITKRLRKALASGDLAVHSSVNEEEARLTLIPLGKFAPYEHRRPTFTSFSQFFDTLNRLLPFKYVVMRSHLEVLHAASTGDYGIYSKGKDVDLLINDYYFFKAVTGARAVDTDHMREQNSGTHIQSRISIGGVEVPFDVRFVGDGYIHPWWVGAMLKRRVAFPRRRTSCTRCCITCWCRRPSPAI